MKFCVLLKDDHKASEVRCISSFITKLLKLRSIMRAVLLRLSDPSWIESKYVRPCMPRAGEGGENLFAGVLAENSPMLEEIRQSHASYLFQKGCRTLCLFVCMDQWSGVPYDGSSKRELHTQRHTGIPHNIGLPERTLGNLRVAQHAVFRLTEKYAYHQGKDCYNACSTAIAGYQ